MTTIILIAIIVCVICLFNYAYKHNKELQNNNIIKNIENYEQKEKAKQQKPKVHVKRTAGRKRRTKKSINV